MGWAEEAEDSGIVLEEEVGGERRCSKAAAAAWAAAQRTCSWRLGRHP
jgi:hypothetical protein